MTRNKQNISRTNHIRSSRAPGVIFGDVIYDPGGTCGPRVQQDVQLVLMYSGDATVSVNHVPHTIPKQTVSLMQPGRLEHFWFAKHVPTHHRWCAITPTLLPAALRERLLHLPANLPLSTHLHGLVELGLSIPEHDTSSQQELLVNLAQTTIRQYVLDAEMLGRASTQPNALRLAQQFMDTHLHEQIQVTDVARAAGVTPQHLGKLFRTHLQTTPAQALWRTRAQRGADLLRATGLSVTEVAQRCGFQNPFHFSRVIRTHYGVSPRALRARAWAM